MVLQFPDGEKLSPIYVDAKHSTGFVTVWVYFCAIILPDGEK